MLIAFDVDSTLINDHDEPRYDVIDLFRWFQSHGHTMIIWSGDGVAYAQRWAEKLGLKALILEKCSCNVDIAVDDMMEQENWGREFKARLVIKV